MSVLGLIGLGRAGQSAGASFARALEEIFKLQYLQAQRAAEAEQEREFQRQLLQDRLYADMFARLAGSGLQAIQQYQGYVNPADVQRAVQGLASALGGGPDAFAAPVGDLFRIAAEAAKQKTTEERYTRFAESVRRFAPNASPEAIRNAFAKYMNGEPGWVLDLGVSQAQADEVARNIEQEFRKAQTEAARASTELTRERAATERITRPLNLKLLDERINLLKSQRQLTDAQVDELRTILPERLRRMQLDNELLERRQELIDLQIEAAQLENELAKQVQPARVAEAYARVAELDARTALIAAQEELTRTNATLNQARTAEAWTRIAEANERMRSVFEERFLKLANTDAEAARKFYQANKDTFAALGYTEDVVNSMLDMAARRQQFADPARKEALAVYQTYLDAESAPPQSEWTKRIQELRSQMLRSGIPEDTANNLLAVLLDKWRGLASAEELAWARVRAEQTRYTGEGEKLWLQYVKEFNDNLNESRNDIMRRLDAIQRKYGDCVRLAGDPDFGYAYVQYSSDPTCRERLEQMRREIDPLVGKLNTINRMRTRVSMQIAQRAGIDTNLPPEPFDAEAFARQLIASGVTDPEQIADALIAEARRRGYNFKVPRERVVEEVQKLLPEPEKEQPGGTRRNTPWPVKRSLREFIQESASRID